MELLTTARAVIEALGGARKTAALFGYAPTAAWNWGQHNSFPPDVRDGIQSKLAEIGKQADASLFRMKALVE